MLRLLGLVLVEGAIFFGCLVRVVGRGEPDHGEKRLAALDCPLDKLQRGLGNHFGTLASHDLGLLAIAAQGRVEVEPVVVRKALVKTAPARGRGALGLDRPEMPFAEMPCHVAGRLQRLGQRNLLGPKRPVRRKTARPVWIPAGHHTGPRGRAKRGRGIETLEAQAFGSHAVQLGRLEHRVAVVARIPPPLIVGHDQQDVGPGGSRRLRTGCWFRSPCGNRSQGSQSGQDAHGRNHCGRSALDDNQRCHGSHGAFLLSASRQKGSGAQKRNSRRARAAL